MSPPLVSAIIPTYNRAAMTLRATRSALAQTRQDVEVVIVDDGSTDGTEPLLADELGGLIGDRVRYVRQANAGVSAARNRAVAESQGEFIAFLDSDDEWLPEKTERQLEAFERWSDCGMVVCDFTIVDLDGNPTSVEHRREQYGAGGHVLERLLLRPILVPSTAMLRRSVWDAVGGFDPELRTAEDIDLQLRIAAEYSIGLVEEPLVRYLRGHDSLSETTSSYRDYLDVVTRFVRRHGRAVDRRVARGAIYSARYRLARGLMWNGDRRDSVLNAVRCAPYVTRPGEALDLAELVARNVAYAVLRR